MKIVFVCITDDVCKNRPLFFCQTGTTTDVTQDGLVLRVEAGRTEMKTVAFSTLRQAERSKRACLVSNTLCMSWRDDVGWRSSVVECAEADTLRQTRCSGDSWGLKVIRLVAA